MQGFDVGEPEGKRPLGRSRRKWELLLKLNLKKLKGGHGLDSSGSEQGQVVSCCEHGDEPSGFVRFVEFLCQLRNSDSQEGLLHGITFVRGWLVSCVVLRHQCCQQTEQHKDLVT